MSCSEEGSDEGAYKAMDREAEERDEKKMIADGRLKLLYEEFETVFIQYERHFFAQSAEVYTSN